jgi:hypothetical protein
VNRRECRVAEKAQQGAEMQDYALISPLTAGQIS